MLQQTYFDNNNSKNNSYNSNSRQAPPKTRATLLAKSQSNNRVQQDQQQDSYDFGNYKVIKNNENNNPNYDLIRTRISPQNNNNNKGLPPSQSDSFSKNTKTSGDSNTLFSKSKNRSSSHSVSAGLLKKSDSRSEKPLSSSTSKKTPSRSESVGQANSSGTQRAMRVDYTNPRTCLLKTREDFDGLGIHIACDKKTRRSPYIYNIEVNSPGACAGLRKNDFILEVNDVDAVNVEFNALIERVQECIRDNNLSLTVGNEKAYRKWVKSRSGSVGRGSSTTRSKSSASRK